VKILWLINPDAEIELSHLARGTPGQYATNQATRRAALQRKEAFSVLVGNDSSLFCFEDIQHERLESETSLAVFWCPTPFAQARAEALGFRKYAPAPPLRLLIEANNKTTLAKWALPCVPGRQVINTLEEARSMLSEEPIRFKKPFGFAGRGQRKLTRQTSADDLRWLKDSLTHHGLVAEPELRHPKLCSLHMLISPGGIVLGKPVGFVCDPFGSFEHWNDVDLDESSADWISSRALLSAETLRKEGYLGPLSIDFAQVPDGCIYALDLNARFSLGHRRGLPNLSSEVLSLYQLGAS
jgi:hypothetical protein